MEKSLVSRFRAVWTKKQPELKPVLPEKGESVLSAQVLGKTVPCQTNISSPYLVKVSLIKNVRAGDYEQTVKTLQQIKSTEIEAEDVIPWSLGHNYEVKEITLVESIRNMGDLTGGVIISPDQLASFKRIESREDWTKLIEGPGQSNTDLVALSKELEDAEWQLIKSRQFKDQSIAAVIVIKEKTLKDSQVEHSPQPSPSPSSLENPIGSSFRRMSASEIMELDKN